MYQTVTFADFRDAFRAYDRLENFTIFGARVLFDYLEQYEEDSGERIELDVIALCCDYAEDTPEIIADSYGFSDKIEKLDCDGDLLQAVIACLEDEDAYIGTTNIGTIVFRKF
jgi:hypothetical protein